jgi:hypothetical protein
LMYDAKSQEVVASIKSFAALVSMFEPLWSSCFLHGMMVQVE